MNRSGEVVLIRRVVVHGCALNEFDYNPGVRVQRGPATHPILTITLAGGANETDAHGVSVRRPMSCSYAPAGASAIAVVQSDGWRILTVALARRWALDAVRHLDLRVPSSAGGGRIYRLCERIYHEFRSGDPAASVALEGLIVQIVAETARSAEVKRARRPAWLDAVRAYIDANYRAPLKLPDLARDARVHPAHLSKAFARAFGCSVGEYVRGRRIDFARRQMETSALTLSEIAIAAGFADQSHFTKTFRRVVGASPSEYRQAVMRAAREMGGQRRPLTG